MPPHDNHSPPGKPTCDIRPQTGRFRCLLGRSHGPGRRPAARSGLDPGPHALERSGRNLRDPLHESRRTADRRLVLPPARIGIAAALSRPDRRAGLYLRTHPAEAMGQSRAMRRSASRRAASSARTAGSIPGYPGLLIDNIIDKHTYAYRGFYIDAARAVDFVQSRPEIDHARIGVQGGSQGGALTLTTAALRNDAITCGAAGAPYLTGYMDAASLTHSYPYEEMNEYLRIYPEREEQMRATLDYYDCLNFAPQITCPMLISIGLGDDVCPPETAYDLLRVLGGPVEANAYPRCAHDSGGYLGRRQHRRLPGEASAAHPGASAMTTPDRFRRLLGRHRRGAGQHRPRAGPDRNPVALHRILDLVRSEADQHRALSHLRVPERPERRRPLPGAAPLAALRQRQQSPALGRPATLHRADRHAPGSAPGRYAVQSRIPRVAHPRHRIAGHLDLSRHPGRHHARRGVPAGASEGRSGARRHRRRRPWP